MRRCSSRRWAEPADAVQAASDATVQFPGAGRSRDWCPVQAPSDATVQFRCAGPAARLTVVQAPSDATVQFPALGGRRPMRCGVRPMRRCSSAAVGGSADVAASHLDATCRCPLIGLPTDATMPFRVSQPADTTVRPIHGDREEAELRSLIHSILAGLKPREREVIELSFRHDLDDDDLAIALGVSWSRAHALAARAREPAGRSPRRAAHRAHQAGGLPGAGGVAGRLGRAADRADARPGQLAHQGVPDLRPARMGRAAPGGVFPPAAVGPAPPGTAGAGPEPLYLHG